MRRRVIALYERAADDFAIRIIPRRFSRQREFHYYYMQRDVVSIFAQNASKHAVA